MNSNADIDFLRFLSRERFNMTLVDALSVMNEARRLYTPAPPPREGVTWRGLYFSPEADAALRRSDGLITAIKEVRKDNLAPILTGEYFYNYAPGGVLRLKDAKDVCEARRKFLRGW